MQKRTGDLYTIYWAVGGHDEWRLPIQQSRGLTGGKFAEIMEGLRSDEGSLR